jgi:hypothetical protein
MTEPSIDGYLKKFLVNKMVEEDFAADFLVAWLGIRECPFKDYAKYLEQSYFF